MNSLVFISTTGKGIARAQHKTNGDWLVETFLSNMDVRCLAADPHNSNIVFAGTQGEGVMRSDDMGITWQPAGLDGQIVKALAVSPHDSSTIYAGTKPALMHVSHDSGQNWTELNAFRRIPGRWWWFSPAESPFQAYVQSIAISPSDPNVILAGIEFGAVVRSEDGGQSWSGHRKGALRDCHSLTFHSTHGKWAYEAGGSGGGASFSQDGGLTWRKTKRGLAKNYGVACSYDPQKPGVWYVSVAPGPSRAYGEQAEAYLYRASGGADWHPIGWEAHPMKHMPMILRTHPTTSGQLYAGLTNGDVWHSEDYGDTWVKLPFNLMGVWRSMIVLDMDGS